MPKQPRPTGWPTVGTGSPNVERSREKLTVALTRSNRVAFWDPAAYSLLDFAEKNGLSPPFCCRAGVCGTCLSRVRRGAVAYFELPVTEPAEGEILLCCSRPIESIEIDI